MGRLLLAAVLVAFTAPAIAESDSALLAHPPPRNAAVERSPDAGGAVIPPVAPATGNAIHRVGFLGAVVLPAGGAHPVQPVIRVREIVRRTGDGDYRVLEVVYR